MAGGRGRAGRQAGRDEEGLAKLAVREGTAEATSEQRHDAEMLGEVAQHERNVRRRTADAGLGAEAHEKQARVEEVELGGQVEQPRRFLGAANAPSACNQHAISYDQHAIGKW